MSHINPDPDPVQPDQPDHPVQGKTVGNYMKGINAALILGGGVLVVAFQDGSINLIEIIAFVIALLRGVINFGVRPEWGKVGTYIPLILTAVIGALSQLTAALQDGPNGEMVLATHEIITVAITFLAAMGSTYGTSNAAQSDGLEVR